MRRTVPAAALLAAIMMTGTACATSSGRNGDNTVTTSSRSIPDTLTGDWTSPPGSGSTSQISFTKSGGFTFGGATTALPGGKACSGEVVVSGGTLSLQPSTSDCAARTITYSVDGNVLTLDSSEYFRVGVTPNSAGCLDGPWTLTSASVDAAGSSWGLQERIKISYLYDGNDKVEQLRYAPDGTTTRKVDGLVLAADGQAIQIAVSIDGSSHANYQVSGSTITYSDRTGEYQYTFLYDRQEVNKASLQGSNTPDSFTCDVSHLTLSGTGYTAKYYRGNLR